MCGAETLSLEEQLYLWGIGENAHVDPLSLVEIPIRQKVNHRLFVVIRPGGLVHIKAILFKAGCVDLAEIRVFCKIRRRFAQIVEAAPNILSETEGPVAVGDNSMFGISGSPVGRAVSERGALQVVKGKKPVGKWKMIDAAALYG